MDTYTWDQENDTEKPIYRAGIEREDRMNLRTQLGVGTKVRGTERLRLGEGYGSPLRPAAGKGLHGRKLSLVLCGALEGWDGRGWWWSVGI